jgi:hypothetical protein
MKLLRGMDWPIEHRPLGSAISCVRVHLPAFLRELSR